MRTGLSQTARGKSFLFQHRELIYFALDSENLLEYIWDITETEKVQRCFALVSRQKGETASNITCVQPTIATDKGQNQFFNVESIFSLNFPSEIKKFDPE